MTLESYWLENCPYYDPRVVIYDRKMFMRLATGHTDYGQQNPIIIVGRNLALPSTNENVD